jgi:predicted O-methyltransferase YrrM
MTQVADIATLTPLTDARLTCALKDAQVAQTLNALHADAQNDWKPMLKHAPAAIWGLLGGKSMMKALTPEMLKDAYIPVSPEQGRYLYSLAVAAKARHIVEFGASFGIGTLYLAAAAKHTSGHVITTEIEPDKCSATQGNLAQAGLESFATVLEGDALHTLKDVDPNIDMLFLDGWKDLYIDVLELVRPKLAPGAMVIGDNVNLAEGKAFFDHIKSDPSFVTTKLGRDTSFSVFLGQ